MSKSIYEEAVETLNKYRNQNYNSTDKDEVELANAINVILPKYVKQEKLLERLKKFKETFDNYELAKKQDFIAYENWLECERELAELKRDVKRFMEIFYISDDSALRDEYDELVVKLSKVGDRK